MEGSDIGFDTNRGRIQGTGQGTKWLMQAFDNQSSHGLGMRKVEFHLQTGCAAESH